MQTNSTLTIAFAFASLSRRGGWNIARTARKILDSITLAVTTHAAH